MVFPSLICAFHSVFFDDAKLRINERKGSVDGRDEGRVDGRDENGKIPLFKGLDAIRCER